MIMISLERIIEITNASVYTGSLQGKYVKFAFGSDLMSDVLTLGDKIPLLITGLANPQSIRTAEMIDIEVVLIARGKEIDSEMIHLAHESGIVLLSSSYSVFKICGILYANGVEAIY